MRHYFGGKFKTIINEDDDNAITTEMEGGSAWTLVLGGRIKPAGYPLLLDGSMAFGLNDESEYDWTFKFGIQLLPQAPNADW